MEELLNIIIENVNEQFCQWEGCLADFSDTILLSYKEWLNKELKSIDKTPN